MSAIPKLTAHVVLNASGFVNSGAYQNPYTGKLFVQYRDEDGNVSSPGVATYTRFFVDKPSVVEIMWRNSLEDLYNGVKDSGEDSYNQFTTIHDSDVDEVVRVGCVIMDQYGFFMKAEPAIITVLAPSDEYE